MEILVLAPYLPYPPWFGGASRIYHLIRVLAREHRVTLLCLGTPAEREAAVPLLEACAEVETVPAPAGARWRRLYQARSVVGRPYYHYAYYSPRMARALERLLARRAFDVIQVEFAHMGYYRLPAGPLRVLDEHNVEYRLLERVSRQERDPLRRFYGWVQARKFRRDELAACRRMDAVLVTSAADGAVLAEDVDADVPIRIVPNGVDVDFFRPERSPGAPPTLLFTGAINYVPNSDAVVHFCADILPRIQAAVPGVRFAVVGRDPPERVRGLAGPAVTVTGTVPDVRPWMRQAAVFVVPLRSGGGTRLKILEALASGCAVVSSSIGCEGLEVTHGRDILVADRPAEFAEAVVRCLRDPELRGRLGARGRHLVERRYRWESIGRDLGARYAELQERVQRPAAVPADRWRPGAWAGP
jgi:sugar transferase (PEP-CTERM/EpsH1 system associated)